MLEPKKRWFLWHTLVILGLSAGSIGVVIFALIEAMQNADWVEILIWSFGSLLLFALLLAGLSAPGAYKRWVRFDRRAGLLTISRRRFGFRRRFQVVRSRPLTDIVCIQSLYGGFHNVATEIGEPGTPYGVVHQQYHSYQLNLVFDDPKEPRSNLATHSDWKWMREAGQRLADFLGIPVADQLAHSP